MLVELKDSSPRKTKAVFFWLALVALLILVSFLVRIGLQIVRSPLRILQRVNLVAMIGQQPIVFTFTDSEGLAWILPAKEKVIVPYGFGEYELGKVYDLGELEKKGGLLLQGTVSNFLSASLFGYFVEVKDGQGGETKPPLWLKGQLWQTIKGKAKTNLNKVDAAILFWRLKGINEDSWRVRDYSLSQSEIFKDGKIREESLTMEILNTTDHFGLAQQAGELLEKAGGRVIRVTDAERVENNCRLEVAKEKERSYTLFWLRLVYPQCPVTFRENTAGRAEISLILGEENWKKQSEKW